VRSQLKFGADQFSRSDVSWIQKDKQSIYRVSQKKCDLRRLVQYSTFFVQLSRMVFFQYF